MFQRMFAQRDIKVQTIKIPDTYLGRKTWQKSQRIIKTKKVQTQLIESGKGNLYRSDSHFDLKIMKEVENHGKDTWNINI